MIAAYYGQHFSLEYLRELTAISKQGVTLSAITEAAETIGFRTLPAELPLEALQKKVPLPCIVHWDHGHFVVLYETKKEKLYVADPDLGRVIYTPTEFLAKWQLPQAVGSGVVLLLEPTPKLFETAAQAEDEVGFSYLLAYARPYKKLIFQLFLGLGVGSLLSLIFPFLTQSIVDVGIHTQNIHFVYLICLAQLMLFLGRTAIELIRARILLLIGSRVSISLLSDYLIKMMKLPMLFFESKNVGDNMQRIVDHQRIETFLTSSLINTIFSLFNLVIFGLVLLLYSGSIFLVFLVSTCLGVVWTKLFLDQRQRMDHQRFQQYAQNQSTLVEIINSMPEIKLTGSEKEKRWKWEELQAKTYHVNIKTLYLDQYIQGGILFFNELKNIIITIMAGMQVINGQLTLGMMLSITYITGQLSNPVLQLLEFLKNAQDAKLSLARFNEVHQKPNEDSEEVIKRKLLPSTRDLQLDTISFRYGGTDAPFVLQNLSLTIPEGKVTAIVGTSGSGKTTLLKLLLKFYKPASGEIKVGHTNLEQISASQWRKRFGVVMQEGYIFSDTIAQNIAVGTGPIDFEKLRYASRIANIEPFIDELPLGYHTPIGGEGAGLSQGQKQRILIARAAYRNPEYILFDEATNALDASNERIIMENLNTFFKGKTVIVVAHRLSTVQHADQIVVIEKGQIKEIGTHQELIARQGSYYELIRNQLALGV
jgi:ATP-binding cassette subfamily B protein